MTRVIAALDNSLAARPVLATAQGLAELFGARIDAVHVRKNGTRVASNEAAAVGLELRMLLGPTVEQLAEIADAEDVAAVVIGARGTPAGSRPVGGTAFELMKSLDKPLVVVPPDAVRPGVLRRVIVPLEGTLSTSLAPRRLIEFACDAELDVVVLHVHDEASLPAFTDQPQHETDAWAVEFLARYAPAGVGKVRLEVRVGRREEQILRAAEEIGGDLIALGWSQDLAGDRAAVVRAVLDRGRIPVMLVPVYLESVAAAGLERSVSWTS
jgi:nucleotide-binding universal stress UspA family protein